MGCEDPKAALKELESLLERARQFEGRLDEVRRLDERRRELEPLVWGRVGTEEYREWEEIRERVNAFYADFRQLVEEARARVEELRAVLGEAEVRRIAQGLHGAAVRSTREALERAVAAVREDVEARREEKRSRRRAAMTGGWAAETRDPRRVARADSAGAGSPGANRASPGPRASQRPHEERAQDQQHGQPEWWYRDDQGSPGRWVTAKQFSSITGIPVGTLAIWRHQDRKAGCAEPQPGKPRYRRFGTAVRYWLPRSLEQPHERAEDGERQEPE